MYQRRRSFRGILVIVLFAIVGWKVIYPAYIANNQPLPTTTTITAFPLQSETVYITVPAPTLTPAPTYTPYPTPTPAPTPEPKVIYTSDADAAYRTWSPRVLLLIIIGFFFWVVGHYYNLKKHEVDRNFELEMAEVKAREEFAKSQVAANTPAPRPIKFNVHRGNGTESHLITAFDKKIPHGKVRDFVENVAWVGLSINQWKAREGWSQQDIEWLLDHLESIQLLHPRQPGKAASWRREVDTEHLARMLGIDPNENTTNQRQNNQA